MKFLTALKIMKMVKIARATSHLKDQSRTEKRSANLAKKARKIKIRL